MELLLSRVVETLFSNIFWFWIRVFLTSLISSLSSTKSITSLAILSLTFNFNSWSAAESLLAITRKRIAEEGTWTLEFISCEQFMLNDEFGGLCLMYQAIHGDEDKTPLPNPAD